MVEAIDDVEYNGIQYIPGYGWWGPLKYVRYYGWRGHPWLVRLGIWLHKLHAPKQVVELFVKPWHVHGSLYILDNLSLTVNIDETDNGES